MQTAQPGTTTEGGPHASSDQATSPLGLCQTKATHANIIPVNHTSSLILGWIYSKMANIGIFYRQSQIYARIHHGSRGNSTTLAVTFILNSSWIDFHPAFSQMQTTLLCKFILHMERQKMYSREC